MVYGLVLKENPFIRYHSILRPIWGINNATNSLEALEIPLQQVFC